MKKNFDTLGAGTSKEPAVHAKLLAKKIEAIDAIPGTAQSKVLLEKKEILLNVVWFL